MSTAWITLQDRLARAFDVFHKVASQLDPAVRDRAGVCDSWSPKDVIAHLIGWDLEAARRLWAFKAGPTEDPTYDLAAFNAGSVVARQYLSWDEILAELQTAQQTLREAIAALGEEDVAREPRISEWVAGRSSDYEEHTAQLRQWLQLSPPENPMQIEILGSGGAITIPRPACKCKVCVQARDMGLPYSRTGPSLFIHGPDILIDTPEEIKEQLNRSQVKQIKACFYSHWHPDHVMGRRVWEVRNGDWLSWPPQHQRTDIYLPQQVGQDFRTRLGSWEHFSFMAGQGLVRLIELADGEVVTLGSTQIRPFRLAEDYVYAFLLEERGKRILIAPDELLGWQPPLDTYNVDLAVIPMGLAEFHPLTGERLISEAHPVLEQEATFLQTLEMVRKMAPQRTVMTHIEEPVGLGYDDLRLVEEKLQAEGLNITFAYDTMLIEV
jgi:phosphoribosyl 1,2-cyclic phosphate phosphodiesterase